MTNDFISKASSIVSRFEEDLKNIRTGRAHPSMVADVTVEAYGSLTPLARVASVSVADAKTIVIEPWDKSIVKNIEKGIVAANLNLAPNVDGNIIRIRLPEMTEETRKQMVKRLNDRHEEARISIRQAREETKKALEKQESDGDMGEDECRNLIKKLDDETKKTTDNLADITKSKETEIMTV